ncbi:MAG: SUMF1/EgtB/PvdO family nonheme iron enzyme [Myxococcales bacterium]|nr:SUMF1/EgtB/PvdO family nonheme iron enzyme [Myxococcales bacterium]
MARVKWLVWLVAMTPAVAWAEAPVVAVFALEAKGTTLGSADLDGLMDYVEASLAESKRYQVIPRTELKAALNRQKAESYKACYDESCQIEIGKEVAAEKSLAGAVTRFGNSCLVTLKLYDLAKATQEAAGTAKGGCDAEGVLASLDAALGKLTGKVPAASTVAPKAPPRPRIDRVVVPEGRFRFGCDPAKDRACRSEDPLVRDATLAEFRIDRREVTVADYGGCVEAGACSAAGLELPHWEGLDRAEWAWACNWGKAGREQHPVNCVDWGQADAYCRWAQGRLPTEAEWEKAARGTDGRTYPWGAQAYRTKKLANIADEAAKRAQPRWFVAEGYDDGFYGTAPVGSFPAGASPFGAEDMIGNVVEWSASWFTQGGLRSTRGGGWSTLPDAARVAFRSHGNPTERHESTGFRCVDGAGGDVSLAATPALTPAVKPKTRLRDLLAPKPPSGPLTSKTFLQVMKLHKDTARECHQQHARGWSGVVSLEITVGSQGQVTHAAAHAKGQAQPGLERCLVEEIERIRFSKPEDGEMSFRYPLVLRPGD